MITQLHPIITHSEIQRIIRKLVQHHRPDAQGRDNILTLDHLPSEGSVMPTIASSAVLKSSFITDLFAERLEITSSFGKVSSVDGYPFDVVIGYPPYTAWFPKDYPFSEDLPIEVLFIYLTFQVLQTDGLLFVISNSDRSHWPEDQIHKIGKLIDVYLLPAAFIQPAGNEILVYRKKPTDAVRYE